MRLICVRVKLCSKTCTYLRMLQHQSQLPISFYMRYGRHMQAMCQSIQTKMHTFAVIHKSFSTQRVCNVHDTPDCHTSPYILQIWQLTNNFHQTSGYILQIGTHTIKGSKAPAGQTADCRSTESGKYSTGTSMEFVLFLLAGLLSLTEGQSEWRFLMIPTCYDLCSLYMTYS